MKDHFITQKPSHDFISTLVDHYFFIDISVNAFLERPEYVIPFPRITFGYFFDHPFLVTNHNLKESKKVDMVISRIANHKITVLPLTDRIKIIGAHARPYTLAYLTKQPIKGLPWLIDMADLFGNTAAQFRHAVMECVGPEKMFEEVEKVFLNTVLTRNLQAIKRAVDLIEECEGDINLTKVAGYTGLSDRSIRNQFYKYIGCAPKEFIQLVQLRKSAYQMHSTEHSLTNITYENGYFDQAHFINTFKRITGKTPKELRKEMPDFRFLQF